MTTHRPFLMGAETEFAVAGERHGEYVDPDDLYDLLAEAVKGARAWVEDHHGYRGLYLENGSRLYLDYGSHPEHATAECFTPRQVTLYDKAGEHLMHLAAEGAMRAHPGLTLRVLKNNLDPVDPDDCTYGTHESYTCWVTAAEAGSALIPHLVSRVLYCGSGGLSRHPQGMGFELSQRARHLVRVQGDDTTSNRAIFSTRARKEIDNAHAGWMRVHLIGKDSQRAPLGIYLTYGVTGLLIEMLNRGLGVGRGLELAEPVRALRAFSLDPWCKATAALADGRHLTAAQIQALYLEECERAVQGGGMPEWAPEVLGHWRQTLADLERDPLRLADRLDPYAKLLIYRHELSRAGFDWPALRDALARLADLRDRHGAAVVQAVLRDSDAGLEGEQQQEFAGAVEVAGTRQPRGLEVMHLALRMQALDVQYHQLGGLYDRLHAAGRVGGFVTADEVEEASRVAPPGGRAGLRGAWIRDHQEGDWRADWQFVWRVSTRQCLDLRDPFAPRGDVRTIEVPEGEEPCYVEVLELLQAPAGEAAATA